MPYIKKEQRDELNHSPDVWPRNAGELNYALTVILKYAIGHAAKMPEPFKPVAIFEVINLWGAATWQYIDDLGLKYQTLNDIVGVWTSAFLELERRHPELMEDKFYQELSEAFTDGLQIFYTNVVGPYEDTKIKENGDV